MSTTDYMRRRRFINALVSDTKLEYREERDAIPHTKGNMVVMPPYQPNFTPEQDVMWMESLITQCYANMPENIKDIYTMKAHGIDPTDNFGYIYQQVCKHNQQRKRDGILFGADEYVDAATQMRITSTNREESSPQALALQALDVAARMEWQLGTDHGLISSLDGEAKELFDKLSPLVEEYARVKEGGESYELAKSIAKLLDVEHESKPEQSDGGGDSGDEGGEGEAPSKEGGEGEGTDKKGKGKGSGEQEDGKGDEKGPDVKPQGESRNPTSIDGTPNPGVKIPWQDTGNALYSLSSVTIKPDPANCTTRYDRYIRESLTHGLSTKVRNVLKVHSQAKYRGGKKKGKINKRAIASITTGNEAIFRKKEQAPILDTAVMILTDCSGSMSGSRYSHAGAACTMLVDTLQKLNIPVACYGFSHDYRDNPEAVEASYGGGTNIMYQFKPFNERVEEDTLIRRLSSEDVDLHGNSDAEALMYGYDLLLHQKQKRKIMIVLSDGQPADGHNPHVFLRKVAEDIERERRCELYAIGIETHDPERYYSNVTVLNEASELEDKLLNLMKNTLTGS